MIYELAEFVANKYVIILIIKVGSQKSFDPFVIDVFFDKYFKEKEMEFLRERFLQKTSSN